MKTCNPTLPISLGPQGAVPQGPHEALGQIARYRFTVSVRCQCG